MKRVAVQPYESHLRKRIQKLSRDQISGQVANLFLKNFEV